jgi:hypothetical protein
MNETPTAEDDRAPSMDKAMNTSNIIRVVQTALIAIGLAFGISVVVAGHWWSDKPKLNLDDLGQHVTSSMQTQFDTKQPGETKNFGLHVGKDIFLINVNGHGNEYRGMVTVTVLYPNRFDLVTHEPKAASSTDVQVAFTVYADDTGRMMWQLDPASSAKLATTAEKDE